MPSSDCIQVGAGDGRRYRDGMTDAERLMRHIIQGTAPGRPLKSRFNDLYESGIGSRSLPFEPQGDREQQAWLRAGFIVVGQAYDGHPSSIKSFRDFNESAAALATWAEKVIPDQGKAVAKANRLFKGFVTALASHGQVHGPVAIVRKIKLRYQEGTPHTLIGYCSWAFFDQWRVDLLP